jgi:S1-C subfamily serine protease
VTIASALIANSLATSATSAAGSQELQSIEAQAIRLFQRATPSVVYINTFVERLDAFSMNVYELPQGTGSGFVWDKDGHIVTNFHVIRDSGSAKVVLTNSVGKSQSFRAEVTGVDPDKDVAVLKVDPKLLGEENIKLVPVQLGSSSNLLVGQIGSDDLLVPTKFVKLLF